MPKSPSPRSTARAETIAILRDINRDQFNTTAVYKFPAKVEGAPGIYTSGLQFTGKELITRRLIRNGLVKGHRTGLTATPSTVEFAIRLFRQEVISLG